MNLSLEAALRALRGALTFDPRRRRVLAALALGAAVATLPWAELSLAHRSNKEWIGTFATSPQFIRTTDTPVVFPAQTTVRQVVRTSLGGAIVRVRLSNEYGTQPLTIGAARVALRSTEAGIVPGTDRVLEFGGHTSVKIPPGAPVLSDPVFLHVPPLSDLSVSIYLPDETTGSTLHRVGLQTVYTAAGNQTGAATLPAAGPTYQNYFFLTGVEVLAHERAAALVTLGDSITDGTRSTPDTNSRWPNFLAERLQMAHRFGGEVAVLNEGISGNRIFSGDAGEPTLSRFDRDVLSKPGVRFMTVLIGINDIGNSARGTGPLVTADEIIAGYRQIIRRARAHDIKVYGATLTPIQGSGYDFPQAEMDRQAVNTWLRTQGRKEFDAIIDFDRATRDPANPARFLPAYDSGDHLHPNDAGYRAMAEAIPLSLFRLEHDRERHW